MRFFADTLTSIRLTLSNPCLEFPIYIAYLTKYAKKLEILALQYDPKAPSSWPNTYHCASFCSLGLLELSHLRGLRLTNIYTRPSAIRELASLPLLEQLDLSLKASYGFRDDRARTRGVQTEFSALRELTLHVNDFSLPLTILGNISAPCLKDLSIICTSDPSSDPDCIVSTSLIESVFGAIAAHPSLQRLCFWISPVQPPCNFSAAVRPLLGLPNITLLAMVNWIAITVDDATLDAMSRAWPGLECLNLHQASRYAIKAGGDAAPVHREAFPTSPKATLCGLIPLALHCPRLHTISLDIDTDLPASVATSPSIPPPMHDIDFGLFCAHSKHVPEPRLPRVLPENSALIRLYVGVYARARDPERIATLLSAIFPRLERVAYGFEDGLDTSEGWRLLEYFLADFRLVREQERRWRQRAIPAGSAPHFLIE